MIFTSCFCNSTSLDSYTWENVLSHENSDDLPVFQVDKQYMQGLAMAYIHKDIPIDIHKVINYFALKSAVAAMLTIKQVSYV